MKGHWSIVNLREALINVISRGGMSPSSLLGAARFARKNSLFPSLPFSPIFSPLPPPTPNPLPPLISDLLLTLSAPSYRITSVLRAGTLWLYLKKYLSYSTHFLILKYKIYSVSEKNVLLRRIFHFSIITGKTWSIYGGILQLETFCFINMGQNG